jgi:hypothetical protein
VITEVCQAGNPPGHKLLIMMHYDQGGNNQLSQAFYQNLISRGGSLTAPATPSRGQLC